MRSGISARPPASFPDVVVPSSRRRGARRTYFVLLLALTYCGRAVAETYAPTETPRTSPTQSSQPNSTHGLSFSALSQTAHPTAAPSDRPTVAPTRGTREPTAAPTPTPTAKLNGPNFLYFLADDLGYGEISIMPGRTNFNLKTPNIDQFFTEGMRFTSFYANQECIPSRSSLMTGKHLGHATLRSNHLQTGLRSTDVTFLEKLQEGGYETSCIGKWHLAGQYNVLKWQYKVDPPGTPWNKGCSRYFGGEIFTWFYPTERVYRYNKEDGVQELKYPENTNATRDRCMAANNTCVWLTELNLQEALSELEYHKARQDAEAAAGVVPAPFFVYLAWVDPHLGTWGVDDTIKERTFNVVPDNADFAKQKWPYYEKDHAASIHTYHDRYVGTVLQKLEDLGLRNDTVVIYSSDNGANTGKSGTHQGSFFDSSGPLQGYKFWLTEGGIRVPAAIRWPGKIVAGTISDEPLAIWDLFPTILDIAGMSQAQWPADLDGVSFYKDVLQQQPPAGSNVVVSSASYLHPPLYWEACGGSKQRPGWAASRKQDTAFMRAIRVGKWKGFQCFLDGEFSELRLYDMDTDIGETTDVSADNIDITLNLQALLDDPSMRNASASGLNYTAADAGCDLYYGSTLHRA